jgi:hypothetical protein
MLVGLDGGTGARETPRTVGEALEAYANQRLGRVGPEREPGVQVALEVLAAFFHDEHAALVAGSQAPERTDGLCTTQLPARCLLHGVHASAHLFPYSCVVSAGVIGCFAAEVRSIASWSLSAGLCPPAGLEQFRAGFREALGGLRVHRELQVALELAHLPFAVAVDGTLVQGRFLVEGIDPLGVRVGVPHKSERYRVRLPGAVRRLFRPGQAVSLAMAERALGWSPVGASLPADPDWIERRIDQLQAMRWPRPGDHLRDASRGISPGASAAPPPAGKSGAGLPRARPFPRD